MRFAKLLRQFEVQCKMCELFKILLVDEVDHIIAVLTDEVLFLADVLLVLQIFACAEIVDVLRELFIFWELA